MNRLVHLLILAAVVLHECPASAQLPTPTPFPAWLQNDTSLSCAPPAQRFYDRCVNTLTIFGQRNFTEAALGQPTRNSQVHAPGVIVDRSPCDGVPCPNKVYVVDTGNNRILGYRSLGHCWLGHSEAHPCTNDRDCPGGRRCEIDPSAEAASIVLGQGGFDESSCNRDSNIGMNGPASADSLCFAEQPSGANRAEFWRRINIDIDRDGNLYVPDVQNNRVLKFNQPLSEDRSGGKGDSIADFVWGQPDMENNAWGSSLSSLHLTSVDESTVILGWGVSADGAGGVWVADTLNHRVLHFPADTKTADVVVGQGTASCHRPSDRLCYPILARQDGNELWVLDENDSDGLPFSSRFVVYNPTDTGWQKSAIRVPLSGYRRDAASPEIFQATGFIFKPTLPGVTDPYPNGYIWVNEDEADRTLLLDHDGEILTAIGSVEDPPGSGQYRQGCSGVDYADCGQVIGLDPRLTGRVTDYRLCWPGGSIGIDSDDNIYLADEGYNGIARFKLPYGPVINPTPGATPGLCLPGANGGLSGGNLPTDVHFNEGVGMTISDPVPRTRRNVPQLFVRDTGQMYAWNDYAARGSGQAADAIVDFPYGGRAYSAVDDLHHLWTNRGGALMVYQLPLTNAGEPLVPECFRCAQASGSPALNLLWNDDESPITYQISESNGIAFDNSDPRHKAIWVADGNRILRIGNYYEVGIEPLFVDMVIGQNAKTQLVGEGEVPANYCNRNPISATRVNGIQPLTRPGPNTLCEPADIAFDAHGDLFVVESNYECVWAGNDRVSVFLAADINAAIERGEVFPDLAARKVFVAPSLTDRSRACINRPGAPGHPVTIAFNSRNQMILANDGTSWGSERDRSLQQLWFYKDPLAQWIHHPSDASLNGQLVQQQLPDAVVRLPMGAPGQMQFDSADNLLVQDHTWERVWLLNFDDDIDPATGWSTWLVPTSLDSDQDGIVNLYDPFPYGDPPAVPDFCVGDCRKMRTVSSADLVLGLRIALGDESPDRCPAFDGNDDGAVSVSELVEGVNNALHGCPPRGAR